MLIIPHLPQSRTGLHQDAFVPALKEMSPLSTQSIESIGERRLQPLYARDQVSLRRLQRQVVVIAHDHKAMQTPPTALAGRKQTLLERAFRLLFLEDPRPVVPPVDHMVDCSGKFQPQLPSHFPTL